ncbi:phage tail protein [Hahella sp. NBU794]|uniref:phage tail protein n=1 Tax=Hahella sp. NBU794 TaxID=3422590 RepID=UPI003D6EB273
MSEPFIAEIRLLPYTYAPRNWAYCAGQILPISQNSALFAVTGTLYGGDGRVTVGIPGMLGRTPLHSGASAGPGQRFYPLAERYGAPEVELEISQIPSHTHSLFAATSPGDNTEPQDRFFAYQQGDFQPDYKQEPFGSLAEMSDQMLDNSGDNQPHPNMQPFLALPFCIALDGVFPTRN